MRLSTGCRFETLLSGAILSTILSGALSSTTGLVHLYKPSLRRPTVLESCRFRNRKKSSKPRYINRTATRPASWAQSTLRSKAFGLPGDRTVIILDGRAILDERQLVQSAAAFSVSRIPAGAKSARWG